MSQEMKGIFVRTAQKTPSKVHGLAALGWKSLGSNHNSLET